MRAALSLAALVARARGLSEAQRFDAAYARRSLESVAGLDGVGPHALEQLGREVAQVVNVDRVASDEDMAEDETFALAHSRAVDAIRRFSAASRPPGSRSERDALVFEEAAPADPGVFASLVSFALDRPVPWERDCSCCYPICPGDRWCIKQADKRYLACAGYSVRQHLKFAIVDRPVALFACIAAVVFFVDTWLTASALVSASRARRARAKPPRERRAPPNGGRAMI